MNNLLGTRSWASNAAVKRAHAFPGLRVAETCSSQLLQSSSTPNSCARPSISNIPLSCSMIYETVAELNLQAVRLGQNFETFTNTFLHVPRIVANSSVRDIIYLACVHVMDKLSKSVWMSVRHTHRGWISRCPDPLRGCKVLAPREIEAAYRFQTIITMGQRRKGDNEGRALL